MALGDLVFANVVDRRQYAAQGREAPAGVFLISLPGRALPFVLYRAWKLPQGVVAEEARLISPSGRLAYRWGPEVRRMRGAMDLTIEEDVVEEAVLTETGVYVASFIVDDEVLGEIEVPVQLQEAPKQFPKEYEDGLKRSDVIWIGREGAPKGQTIPVWFVYRQGRIYVVSKSEPGPEEQTIPGLDGATEMIVITRRKGRDTALERFRASVRILEGDEWQQAAAVLADRRRTRPGPPEDRIEKWRDSCVIAELTPLVPV